MKNVSESSNSSRPSTEQFHPLPNPVEQGMITVNSAGLGVASPELVEQRAEELAAINGRDPGVVFRSDRDQARRELTDQSELNTLETTIDEAPESERWDVVPGSTGHQAPQVALEGDDGEGRTISERMVQEGIDEAEHDQMRQGAEMDQGE